jgi:hypothetical protein
VKNSKKNKYVEPALPAASTYLYFYGFSDSGCGCLKEFVRYDWNFPALDQLRG